MTDKAIHRELGLPYSKTVNFDDVARLVERRVAETEDLDFKHILALHNWGCSWGLNPPVSRSARVM